MSIQVVVDTREKAPWKFEGQIGISTVRAKLDAGDYSVVGLELRVAIERKSLDDWVQSVVRERSRFYRELALLRAYDFRAVIVEAGVREIMEHRYTSSVPPAVVLGFAAEVMVAQSVPVIMAGTRAEAQIYAGELLKMAAKKLPAMAAGAAADPATAD